MSRPKPGVIKALKSNLPKRAGLLLAVSGGADSVSLFHGCRSLMRLMKLRLEVAHVEHGLRVEAVKEAGFVERIAAKAGIPFHLKRLKPPKGENLEAWGRRERYRFFAQVLDSRNLDFVVTAHTASDVAETLLMRLVANKELGSILELDLRRRCLRPLLSVDRETIEAFVRAQRLRYVVDGSNLDTSFLRNRVRLKLIPFLKREFDPRIEEVLAQRAFGLREDRECLEAQVAVPLAGIAAHAEGSKTWLKSAKCELERLPDALKWRLVEELFKPELGFNLGRTRAKMLVRFLLGEGEGIELATGLTLRRHKGGVRISRD
jgi:tRNA(Ile)-lysidine synthase